MCLIDSDFDTEDEEFADDIEELISGASAKKDLYGRNSLQVRVTGSSNIHNNKKSPFFSGEPKITTFCHLDSDRDELMSSSSSSSDDAI